MTADVCVVIPTRNRRPLLSATLASVLAQRDVDLQVVVVDDASTDDTAAWVGNLADPRVTLLRHPAARGDAAGRNTGIAAADATWVAFCDDDDLWAPSKLALQIAAATDTGREWAYGAAVGVDGSLRPFSGGPPVSPQRLVSSLPRYNAVPAGASNVVVRAAALAEVGPFDETLRQVMDWDMWLRLARRGLPACVPEPLVAYRHHVGNVAVADLELMISEPDLLARRYGIPVDRKAMLRRAAWTCLRAGHRIKALRYYARAVRAGDLTSVARAGVALLSPSVGRNELFRLLERRSRLGHWPDSSLAWLHELA